MPDMSLRAPNGLLLLSRRIPNDTNKLASNYLRLSLPSIRRNPQTRIFSSLHNHPPGSPQYPHSKHHSFRLQALLAFLVLSVLLSFRFLLSAIPPNFSQCWTHLLSISRKAETIGTHLPSHLWQAVVASEDRRFFRHCGIDLVGISRAVLFFPAGGGGSTITQQLVKNVFLKSERKFSRKVVEMVLALILERRLSKWKILWSYLSMIYWGHGVYGIEAASNFYFGKQPSILSLGEAAMLAGIIPSPELRSPFTEPSRGKVSQARALRRMVKAGFLDIETALVVVNQPLYLRVDEPEPRTQLLRSLYHGKETGESAKQAKALATKEIWDWEKASSVWEVREDMEKWATRIRRT